MLVWESLEVRAPLLDHKLMESMARMPSSIHGRSGKDIFKKAMTGILPDEILRRNKQGFTIPVAQWFRGELKDVAHSLIFPSNTSILDRSYLERIWDQHQKVLYDHSAQLWTVLMFRKWQDVFSG